MYKIAKPSKNYHDSRNSGSKKIKNNKNDIDNLNSDSRYENNVKNKG